MYDQILLPTDGSKGVDRAIDHAIDAAERYGATLHVLYVVDSDVVNAYSGDEFVDGSEGAARDAGRARPRGARRGGLARRGRGRRRGDRAGVRRPHEEILGYINDEDIDLTVMGSKTRSGNYRRMLGSVTERVSRQSTAPVSIVKTTVSE